MEDLLMVNFKGRYFKIIQGIADPFTFVGCCKLDLVLSIIMASSKAKKKKKNQEKTKKPNQKAPKNEKRKKNPSYWEFNSGDIPAWAVISHTYLIVLIHIEGKKSIVIMVHMT